MNELTTQNPSSEAGGQLTAVREQVLSADVREFMHRPPHWMLRSGTLVLAGVLGVFLFLTIVIQYPDTITSRVSITGTQPVVEVVARQSGHLDSLQVQERQQVKKGDIMAIIESPAQSKVVLRLAAKLEQLAEGLSSDATALSIPFKQEEGLGKLQESYADFLNAFRELTSRLADNYAENAGALLRVQLNGKQQQISSLKKQVEMNTRELELSRENYTRMKALHARDSISTAQFQEHELALLQQMRADTAAQRALTDAEIDAARIGKEIRDLEHERTETLRMAREQLRAKLQKLRGDIALWEADHVLRAPADGLVAFYDFWSDQQFVTAGRQVFLIAPQTTRLLGRMSVKPGGAGKIKAGQTVRLRLDDYPYKEFGLVTGKVQSVSMVARDGANLVSIALPHPLVTSFHQTIEFKQEMTGEASIVTEEIRLIGRILYEIRRAVVNNT